jgi:hypothetical protein
MKKKINEIQLYQPREYYRNYDTKEFLNFFGDIGDDDSLEGESPFSFEICTESDYETKDYLNKIPKQEENDLNVQNDVYILNENLEWYQRDPLPDHLTIPTRDKWLHNERRQRKAKVNQKNYFIFIILNLIQTYMKILEVIIIKIL